METFLPQGFAAVWNGAGSRAGGEDAVDASGAHFVIAFWVDEELEGGVKVAVRFADGTDVIGGVGVDGLRCPVVHHVCC
jgi:hypothetical protein